MGLWNRNGKFKRTINSPRMYDTVLCIPYRNRKHQLDYFLEHSVPAIEAHAGAVHFVIIEQSEDGQLFNRGKLLNVAFKEFETRAVHCMTHDVDINPKDERVLTQYGIPIEENAVLGIYTSSCNTLGGIVKCRLSTMKKCNGFPNDFWGWGVEDKALQNRCEVNQITIRKTILNNDPLRAFYFTIFNDVEDRVKSDDFTARTHHEYNRTMTLDERKVQIESNGLSNVSYKILRTTLVSPNVTHLLVEL